MKLRRSDYEGHNVYERTWGDVGMKDAVAYGVYAPMGQLPTDITNLFAPVFMTEDRNGLTYVRSDAKEPAISALSLLVFNPSGAVPPATNVTGTADMPLAPGPKDWVASYVAQGYVVMVDKTSAVYKGPPILVACSKDPQVVAATAGIGRQAAVVDGPAALLTAAEALAAPSAPPGTAGQCPVGQQWVPVLNQCVAVPSVPNVPGMPSIPWLPSDQKTTPATPATQQAPATTQNKWVLPVALGLGAVAVVGAIVVLGKPKATARR